MKLRRKSVQRARQQQQEHVKVSVLCDTDSNQLDSVKEIKDHASVIHDMKRPIKKSRAGASCLLSKDDCMKLRGKTVQRARQQQREHVKVSKSISVVLSDADSSQSDSVKEIKDHASVIHDMKRPIKKSRAGASCRLSKDDFMKLRGKTVQRGRQEQREHNVSENISVVLSDTDSSQSDSVEEIKDHVSVIDMKRPIKKSRTGASCRLSKEDERPLSIVEPQYGTVQKISLAPGAMAEDTLGKLRLMANTSDSELRPRSLVESRGESVLDESSTDLMVESGPSSPCGPVVTVRCKECESLFAKMRRQPTPKKKSRDRNPASLSCDEWILLKKWHPQRHRHREKGLLWASLTRIRKLSAQGSDFAAINRNQVNCSRPHVFQQRSLRRCKYLNSIQTGLSITKAKPRHRKRPRTVVWPPVGGWNSAVKRKSSSINDTLSQQLSPLNLSVSVTQEDRLLVDEQISGLNVDLKQNSDASSKQRRTNVRGKLNKQEVSDGIDGTRRVLKFDDTTETVTVETTGQRKSPRQQHEHGEICEAQKGFQNEQQEKLSEDSDGFRTPTDLVSVKPKIKRGNQKKVSASGDTKPAAQKPNFMSMLATLVKKQNQIIKEPCK